VLAVAEHITILDTLYALSRTELMVYCNVGRQAKLVIAVEGKCDEGFDEPICYWIRNARVKAANGFT